MHVVETAWTDLIALPIIGISAFAVGCGGFNYTKGVSCRGHVVARGITEHLQLHCVQQSVVGTSGIEQNGTLAFTAAEDDQCEEWKAPKGVFLLRWSDMAECTMVETTEHEEALLLRDYPGDEQHCAWIRQFYE